MPSKPALATPTIKHLDRALVTVATLAAKSAKLSASEKKELRELAAKGVKAKGWSVADRGRCVWLIRKAGPESVPDVKIPPRLKKLLGRRPGDDESPKAVGALPDVDPLVRIAKLGKLRGGVLSEAQYQAQLQRIIGDDAIGSYRDSETADPLDRLAKVGALQADGFLTDEQATAIVDAILEHA